MANRSYLDLEDELDDEYLPYDSISSRGPLQSFTADNPELSGIMGGGMMPSLGAPDPRVKNAIKKRAQEVLNNPLTDQGDSAIDVAGDLNKDPLLSQFEESQDKLDEYRDAKRGADLITNMGQAAVTFAQGANAPRANPQFFANLENQNQALLEGKERDLQRRSKVLEAIEARKAKAQENAKIREQRAFEAGENRKLREAALASSQNYKDARQDAMVNRTMSAVVSRINNDPVIKPSELNIASLQKSKMILDNQDVPLTSQALADAEMDIANALQLRGMGATEGKIRRTELETIGRRISELKQRYGGSIQDLRKTDPALVNQIKKVNEALIDDYKTTIKERYGKVYGDFEAAFGDDERFLSRINKMRDHALKGFESSSQEKPKPQDPDLKKALGGPKAGDVENGYRFKGGDPGDKNNWERVK